MLFAIQAHMAYQQVPVEILVMRTHDLGKDGILLFSFTLLVLFHIAPYQDEYGQDNADNHGREVSEVHDTGNQVYYDEGHTSRDKPASYHRKHTCNAEYSALTTPGPVCQTGTHGHHKCDIGGGERQLEPSSCCYKQTSQHQIYRCTYLVKGCSIS